MRAPYRMTDRRIMDRYRKILLLSLKIGIGGSVAIYIAQSMDLEYPISAGTVTLLTLMASKWETIKLSACRLVTLFTTLVMAWVIFTYVNSIWMGYGLLLALVVFTAEFFDWRATISVNALIAARLVTTRDFTPEAVENEFMLVIIGIVIAVVLNLFNLNLTHKRQIIDNMRYTEKKLQKIMEELAAYLSGKEMSQNVWESINKLEKRIQTFIRDAEEYQENTFQSHPEYYIDYFEMRYEQCRILNSLHFEMNKIRSMPKQAEVVAEYLRYLINYIVEINIPDRQIERLKTIFADIKNEELPATVEEFESRAMLYHILMDIEDFLFCKARFVEELDAAQLKRYWRRDVAK